MAGPTTLVQLSVGTALLTLLLAPLAYWLLSRLAVLDVPNHRSSHDRPTVRGGGVACTGALVVVWVSAARLGADLPHASLLAALVLSLLGLADDVWGLPAATRLVLQVLVGAALGATLGGPTTIVLGALVFPVAVNAINFMDGINGITALTMVAWAGVVLVAGSGGAAVLAALALGQALGFLPWNMPRARMFLGDSGSYLFGAMAAGAVLEAQASSTSYWLVIAPFVVYLFDTGYTLVQRARRGAPVLAAHREHLYQRLQASRRWGHSRVAALVAGLSLAVGWACATLSPAAAAVVVVVSLAVYTRLAASTSPRLDRQGVA